MKKILCVVSSINGATSFSTKLSNAILDKLKEVYPKLEIKMRDLSKTPLPYLEVRHFGAFFTPAEHHTADQKEAVKHSDQAIKELKDAEIIIIGVPLYNFTIPATLKAWIDHISRAGETFSFADGTPKGLLTNKKVYLAIASGGIYSEGFMKSYDFTEPYLRAILGFMGLTEITAFRIEGTSTPEFKDTAVLKALETVNKFEF